MLWYSPADGREIRRLFRAVRALQSLSGLTGGAGLLRRTAAGLPELAVYARLTTGELAQRFRHPLLRQFLTAVCDTSFPHWLSWRSWRVLRRQCRPARRGLCRHGRAHGGTLPVAGRCSPIGNKAESIDLSGTGGIRRACGVTVRQGNAGHAHSGGLCHRYCRSGNGLRTHTGCAVARRACPSVCGSAAATLFPAVQAAFACPSVRVGFSGELILPFPAGEDACPHASSVLLRSFRTSRASPRRGIPLCRRWRSAASRRRGGSSLCPARLCRAEAGHCPHLCGYYGGCLPAGRWGRKLRLLDVWTPATYRRFVGTETGSFMSFPMLPGDGFRNGAAELAETPAVRAVARLPCGHCPGYRQCPAGRSGGCAHRAGCLLPPGRDAVRRRGGAVPAAGRTGTGSSCRCGGGVRRTKKG